jgi:glycosyltransferase involved in cell wall biosynthesis
MLKRQDCHSSMLVLYKETDDDTVLKTRPSMALPQRVRRRIGRWQVERDRKCYSAALSKVEQFSDDRGFGADDVNINEADFDIVQLHWVSHFLNYRRFFRSAPKEIPLVWRIADMNPFTGGCSYDGGCGRFEAACGFCPLLQSQKADDLSRSIWKRKQATLKELSPVRLHIVALNQWMANQISRSSLFGRFDCTVIPNGVDLEEFKPIQRNVAREALGVPKGRKIVAFVADSWSYPRKGFRLLLDALDSLKARRDLFLLVVGQPKRLPISLPSLQVGHVQAVTFLRQFYSAADVFVIPSLEDNQPNTVLEAMACGTPVVGFNVGGIPEMIDEGKTGLLVPRGDVQKLARAIEFLLDHEEERGTMAAQARKRAEKRFSREAQVQQYLELYSRLLAKPNEQVPRSTT